MPANIPDVDEIARHCTPSWAMEKDDDGNLVGVKPEAFIVRWGKETGLSVQWLQMLDADLAAAIIKCKQAWQEHRAVKRTDFLGILIVARVRGLEYGLDVQHTIEFGPAHADVTGITQQNQGDVAKALSLLARPVGMPA